MQPDMSWLGVLEHHARRTPDKPLAVYGDDIVTYQEMVDRAAAVAAGLHARGVGAGDVVGLLSYNCTEFLTTIFAANHLGAIAMPINWRLAAAEVRYILEHSRSARARVRRRRSSSSRTRRPSDLDGDLVRVCISAERPAGWDAVRRPRGGRPTRRRRAPGRGDDLHRLMYTSGTTGRPKGVMITHANLAWKNYAHITEFGFTGADVGLACGPLYHVGALDLDHHVDDRGRAPRRSSTACSTPRDVVDEIERSRVTCVWTAPAMVRAILDVPGVEDRDLSSVRLVIAGGEKMPIPFIERLRRTFPSAWFADAYGLTETVSGDTFLDRESTVTKLGSVGRPVPVPRARHLGRARHVGAPG